MINPNLGRELDALCEAIDRDVFIDFRIWRAIRIFWCEGWFAGGCTRYGRT